jgi:hypothetical protein
VKLIHGQRFFENGVLRRILASKRENCRGLEKNAKGDS